MRKLLLILMIVCLGISGCDKKEVHQEEQKQENITCIQSDAIESMTDPDIYLVNGNLLCSELVMDEENSDIVLKMISVEDGSLLAENRLFASGEACIQIGDGSIILQDCGMGTISFLDEELNIQESYEIEQLCDKWFVSLDKENVFMFRYDEGIVSRNMVTEEEQVVLEDVTDISILGHQGAYVIFSCKGEEEQEMLTYSLELSMGMIENLSVDFEVDQGYRFGQTRFLREKDVENRYVIMTEDEIRTLENEDLLGLLGNKRQLLTLDEEKRLTLYELDGTYVSHCFVGENSQCDIASNFIWSGLHEGYFFVEGTENGAKLMFWDPSFQTEGENLEFISVEEVKEVVESFSELKQKAENISEKYDVHIRLGMDCELDYNGYTASVQEDEKAISDALDVLDMCLARYPEGFFTQLKTGMIDSIEIELVDEIKRDEGTEGISMDGFVQEKYDYYLAVLETDLLSERIVYHEITHLIDLRLYWDMRVTDSSMFSEEAWLELQPEGFDYAYSYTEIPDSVKEYYDSGYFVSDYSCTQPTEDRATMMEVAMMGYEIDFAENPGLKPKLEYYSQCIRDCFDTEGWPSVAPWEDLLEN